jgi:hypothetical protein
MSGRVGYGFGDPAFIIFLILILLVFSTPTYYDK